MSTLKQVQNIQDFWFDPEAMTVHYRPWIDGKRRTKSTGVKLTPKEISILLKGPAEEIEKILKKPRRIARQLHKDLLEQSGKKKGLRNLVFEEADSWIELRSSTWSQRTCADVREKFKNHLIPFFGDMLPDEINEVTWEEYISFKVTEGRVKKLARHRTYLSMLLKHLQTKGVIQRRPRLRNPDGETNAGKVYSHEEITALLSEAGSDLKLQILMALKMGMRNGEIIKLRWDRISFKENLIKLRKEDTKTRKARNIPIVPEVLNELLERHKARQGSFVFPGLNDPETHQTTNKTAWQACKKRAKVKGRFHDLRHTCATEMAHSNIAPSIACRILGMSLEVYDKVYCKPSDNQLKKALEQMNWGNE